MSESQALDVNKKGHQQPPVLEAADGLLIQVVELDDGGIEINLDWEPNSKWEYLSSLPGEEATEIIITELVRLAQDEDDVELAGPSEPSGE